MYTPTDYELMRDEWETNKSYGTCGPTCIAIAVEDSVESIINLWVLKKDGDYYKGYANLGDMINVLESYDFEVKRHRGNKSKFFFLPEGHDRAIARIQWEGDWGHWRVAQMNTHYVFIERAVGGVNVLCNGNGWFGEWNEYLKDGHITSLLTWN